MERIDNWDEYFMRIAYMVAQRSRDPRTRIGSVLVRDKAIIATGYNSFPRLVNDNPERYELKALKLELISHSEENTILTSARLGVCTNGTSIYTFGQPCHRCAKALIQGGVSEIILHKQWKFKPSSAAGVNSFELSTMMLNEAGISIRYFDKVLNVKGLMDGEEISI